MFIRAVVVGIDHWEDVTRPFVDGLRLHNPELNIIVVDNQSKTLYPEGVVGGSIFRCDRMGYGQALNFGQQGVEWDWLLCANNDCVCSGNVTEIIKRLRDDTVYGNAWKFDYEWMTALSLPAVVDSAFLLIPRRVWEKIGGFDPKMDAAFEEIDYGLRAIDAGFRLDVADLPISHLNLHTRNELSDYNERWKNTSEYFKEKYKNRMTRNEPV